MAHGVARVAGGRSLAGTRRSGTYWPKLAMALWLPYCWCRIAAKTSGGWKPTMTDAAEYVELHASSAFSFLAGASQPDTLAERAAQIEMPSVALADRNGLYGAARFHTMAKKSGVK